MWLTDWFRRLGSLLQGGPSMRELRHRVRQAPTLANQLALGQALIAGQEYEEALPLLEEARKIEPDHGQVLYGIAVCHARQGRLDEAVPILESILRKDPRWGDDQAAVLLVEVHDQRRDHAAALAKARDLVQQAPTLKHKCVLADLLCDHGGQAEARTLLEQALEDHAFLPAPLRRRNNAWARHAKRLLRNMS